METVYNSPPRRLFVDMDGVLAEFKTIDTLETLYEEGYFYNLEPQESVVNAVWLLAHHPDIEVFILSSVLSDSQYALDEKQKWLDQHLPYIDQEHRIFLPCGEDKKLYIPDGIRSTDFLLDDYTHNLTLWEPPARGVKLLNGINHTKGTWQGRMVDMNMPDYELAAAIQDMILPPVQKQQKKPESYRLVTIEEDDTRFYCKDYTRDTMQLIQDYMQSRTWEEFSADCEMLSVDEAASLEQASEYGESSDLICSVTLSRSSDTLKIYFPQRPLDKCVYEMKLSEAYQDMDKIRELESIKKPVPEQDGIKL